MSTFTKGPNASRSLYSLPDLQLREIVAAFQSITNSVTSQLDQNLVLVNLVDQMMSLLRVEGCSISRFDSIRNAIITIAENGPESWLNPSDAEEVFYLREYAETAEVIFSQRSWQYSRSSLEPGQDELEFMDQYGHKSALLIPMIYHGETVGLIEFVQFSNERVFSESEIQIGELLAAQGAVALANAELFAQTNQQYKEMLALKRAADASNLAKTRFLAKMTHELRTPLNVIIGSGEYVVEEIVEKGLDQDEYDLIEPVNDLLKSAKNLLTIVNDVLSFSKMDTGQMAISTRQFSLQGLLNDISLNAEKMAGEHNNRFVLEIEGAVGLLETDQHKVREILINFLSNAFKFTHDGTVWLTVDIMDEMVQFAVRDTGIGIDPKEQAALFTPFQQVDEQYSRTYSGTGLGLALCNRYAELLQGQISVESELGQGATFFLTIPKKLVIYDR